MQNSVVVPTEMRAAQMTAFGGPEVLRVRRVRVPTPRANEILIRVAASSINGTDVFLRQAKGLMRAATRLPFTLGFDVAGTVAAIGPRVTAFAVGEPVYALLGHGGGGAAEFVLTKEDHAAIAPQSVSLETASAIPLSGLTALQALRGIAGVQADQRVLVYGASGGIGAFAVQLGVHFGARVTGVARAEKLEFVRAQGAHAAVDRNVGLEALGGEWDVILDAAPALEFERARALLKRGGTFVSVRAIPGARAELEGMVGQGGAHWAGVRTAARSEDLAYLARLVDAGVLRVPVDRTFAVDQIADAHRYAGGNEVRGKVVVTM
jgi:NADPH:quinone reductase-like Zn-dependent oxidoreductase